MEDAKPIAGGQQRAFAASVAREPVVVKWGLDRDLPQKITYVAGQVAELRRRGSPVPVFVAHGPLLPGLIFTYMWAFDLPSDQETLNAYAVPFRQRGARILNLELQASQDERLRRNVGEFRLAEKPSKRDIEASRRNLLALDSEHRLNSAGEFDGRDDYLRFDNTHVPPDEVAEHVIERGDFTKPPTFGDG